MPYALLLAAWSLFGSGPHAEQHFTFASAAAPHIRIETANGSITVTTGRPGAGVSVTVTKRADTFDQVGALDVGVERQGNAIAMRGLYPKACGGGSCGGEISFAAVVPPGTSLDLRTSNGGIKATGVSGDARLASSNGSVNASYAALGGVKRVSLDTSNGSISLALPASAQVGKLHMNTSVGRISSDWPVRIDRSNFVGGSVDQTLSPGGPSITLNTTNGSIALRKI
jgi:DUF4097 and DUF4098 domain-containing protein YvlB